MPENDLPKEEKIITEQEFKKEIRKHLLVMEFNKDRLDNFSVLKKLLIITAPFAIAYAVYGYFLYSGFIIGFNLLFLISIIPFLVSLIFNLWILEKYFWIFLFFITFFIFKRESTSIFNSRNHDHFENNF